MNKEGKWTKTAPTEPGWYWWRENSKNHRRQVYACRNPDGSLRVVDDLLIVERDMITSVMCRKYGPAEIGGEWWSEKIKEPV